MRQFLLGLTASVLFATAAHADNSFITTGYITSIQPIWTRVNTSVPVESCRNVSVPVYGTVQKDGNAAGGALAGMIIGGIIGKGVTGKDNGAAAGAVIGGLIGADKGAKGNQEQVVTGYRNERKCTTEYEYVQKTVANEYDITYNVDGSVFTMRVNRVQGERAYVGERRKFRVRYQPLN